MVVLLALGCVWLPLNESYFSNSCLTHHWKNAEEEGMVTLVVDERFCTSHVISYVLVFTLVWDMSHFFICIFVWDVSHVHVCTWDWEEG